jgi:hypothetical protein
MSEDQSQPHGGTSEPSRTAVQTGGAGTEKTPADSDTSQNIFGSLVCSRAIKLCIEFRGLLILLLL